MSKRIRAPRASARMRPSRVVVIALVTAAGLILLHTVSKLSAISTLSLTTPESLRRLANATSAKPESARAQALADAIGHWDAGPAPQLVVAIAAACTPRDAAEAILETLAEEVRSQIVVDIGANKGYPVTRLAILANVGVVIAVEPDQRNFDVLATRKPEQGATYLPVKGAASDKPGEMQFSFNKERDDMGTFDPAEKDLSISSVETVKVHTVDSLVLDGSAGKSVDSELAVALLKTDTQGHEAAVLAGAKRLLASGRVLYVIMEFDPEVFRKRENAMSALNSLFEAGMHCVQLVIAHMAKEEQTPERWPMFGKEISKSNAEEFWQFMKQEKHYTDVLCAKRRFE